MDEAYRKYIKKEKNDGMIASLASAILSIAANDPDTTSDEAIEIVKLATDRAVAIIAKVEGERVDKIE